MMELVKRLYKDEEGQGLAEYGLILAGIAVVCIGAVWAIGGVVSEQLEAAATGIEEGTTSE